MFAFPDFNNLKNRKEIISQEILLAGYRDIVENFSTAKLLFQKVFSFVCRSNKVRKNDLTVKKTKYQSSIGPVFLFLYFSFYFSSAFVKSF
jgi:hypothetical protein